MSTKQAAAVEVVAAKNPSQTLPGPRCGFAKALGIKIELCGDSESEQRLGWDGYVYDHAVLGEGEKAYVAAEDCADAAIEALRRALFTSDELSCIIGALRIKAAREREAAACTDDSSQMMRDIAQTLLAQAEKNSAIAESLED